ncbi:LysR family transcriptional regulator [Pseudooceanicola nitratireducens]|jgi:DNA-binding transcriptional LysR family regulator|uniref:Transcriptional regulator, LysR family n=1 Tax=Pseudooceanicola nitratireducens TaxID=517719 RepID=A0A1I1IHX7_9RHOB|nr:LysR family transcriptional regulator [Pseudooceanicola nitratireducens]SEJ23006.1 DNA-binding transcriptional regulator, LysR family [Pseudooceanicola nitratireducens]SFC35262.1 transcriptional regulator, LysR family [Pseudooceanicola nitratireducens]|eukprot:g15437.t1
MRNLDMTALRSFVAVADHGGVTRAAGVLNFTQSAVSMQLKRLEEMLGLSLLDRTTRKIALTAEGEQLLGYARRIIDLNDEAMSRMTSDVFEGEIVIGVPHDIVYPVIPKVLKRFNAEFPRMKVQLISGYTSKLKTDFSKGLVDLILTTETAPGGDVEVLDERQLCWICAPGGTAWRQRPLRYASARTCLFRVEALRALETAGIDWESAVETDQDRTVEATISADLAIGAMLEGTVPTQLDTVTHNGELPDLGVLQICMYSQDRGFMQVIERLKTLLRAGFSGNDSLPLQGDRELKVVAS